MKIEFQENKHWSGFTLTPETPEEVGQLFRMTKNTKSDKPNLYLSFGSDDKSKVWCNVHLDKVKDKSNKVITSVSNKSR